MPPKPKAKPRRRRQHGSGSIYWSNTDQRWVGSKMHGWTANGTRRRVNVYCSTPGEDGRVECRRKLDERIAQLNRDGATPAAASRTTVKAWSDTWLEQTVHTKRPKSHSTDRSAVKRWIVPILGHKRLDALTVTDIRAVAAAMRKAGRKPSTVLRAQIVLTRMLKDAVTEGGHHVAQAIFLLDNPSRGTSDRDRIQLEHALRMLRRARDLPDGSRWMAAYLQGMRPGECLGLTWPAIDFDAMTLDNSWQLQQLPYKHGCSPKGAGWTCGRRFGGDCPNRELRVPDGYEYRQLEGGYCLVRPKSQAGTRMMPLISVMGAELEAWRDVAPPSPHGLVWPRPDGRPQDPKLDRAAWHRLQRAAGVEAAASRPYHLYEARHTTATLLMELGVDEDVRRAIMGHSAMASTRHYQHVSLDAARTALDAVAVKLELGPRGHEGETS